MDLGQLAQDLIDTHVRQTERLQTLLRAAARQHYASGVRDCLRLMQSAALEDDFRQRTAPLAVQPTHAASEGETP